MGSAHDDERVADGIEHLQSAARELISAARSFLDVLDDVVDDRDKLGDLAATVSSVVESAVRTARTPGDPFKRDDRDRDGVEHVPVD
jgi:hypothetical protein